MSLLVLFQVTLDIPYASPPQGTKYFTLIGPHIDCMDEQYLVRNNLYFKLQILTLSIIKLFEQNLHISDFEFWNQRHLFLIL